MNLQRNVSKKNNKTIVKLKKNLLQKFKQKKKKKIIWEIWSKNQLTNCCG